MVPPVLSSGIPQPLKVSGQCGSARKSAWKYGSQRQRHEYPRIFAAPQRSERSSLDSLMVRCEYTRMPVVSNKLEIAAGTPVVESTNTRQHSPTTVREVRDTKFAATAPRCSTGQKWSNHPLPSSSFYFSTRVGRGWRRRFLSVFRRRARFLLTKDMGYVSSRENEHKRDNSSRSVHVVKTYMAAYRSIRMGRSRAMSLLMA